MPWFLGMQFPISNTSITQGRIREMQILLALSQTNESEFEAGGERIADNAFGCAPSMNLIRARV